MAEREYVLPHLSFGRGVSGVPTLYLGTFCKGAVGWGISRDLASPPQ